RRGSQFFHWLQRIPGAPLLQQIIDALNECGSITLLTSLACQFVAGAMRAQQAVEPLNKGATAEGGGDLLRFLLLLLEAPPVEELIGDIGGEQQNQEDDRDKDAHAAADVALRGVGGLHEGKQHKRRDDHREELRVILCPIAIEDLPALAQSSAEE